MSCLHFFFSSTNSTKSLRFRTVPEWWYMYKFREWRTSLYMHLWWEIPRNNLWRYHCKSQIKLKVWMYQKSKQLSCLLQSMISDQFLCGLQHFLRLKMINMLAWDCPTKAFQYNNITLLTWWRLLLHHAIYNSKPFDCCFSAVWNVELKVPDTTGTGCEPNPCQHEGTLTIKDFIKPDKSILFIIISSSISFQLKYM